MKITCNGHSCFTVEANGYSVVLDPYEDGTVPGLPPLRLDADAVLCSHEHYDHNFRGAVTLSGHGNSPFTVTEVPTFHDDEKGALRGTNIIHILEAGGVKVAHLGDLGHTLSDEQLAQLKGLDAILIPVGGFYTIDAETAKKTADAIGAAVVIPMHYRNGERGFDVLGTLDDFLTLCSNVTAPAKSVEITRGMAAQTVVLDFGA